MSPSISHDAAPRVAPTLARNLPIALLFCAGYFVFFSAVWGPVTRPKILIAALIVVGLALGLRLSDPRREARAARRRQRPGGRAAVDRASWPWWRRAGLLVSGVLLCAAAIYQSLGFEVDLSAYPLLSGLCLILGCAVGATLIGYGWPRERWTRKRRRRHESEQSATLARRRPVPEPPESGNVRTGTSSYRMPTPKDLGFSGLWGGFGSKPARRIWKPGATRSSTSASEPVPRRFRGLRLIRRKRSREEPMSWTARVLVLVLGLGFAAVLLGWILEAL